MRTFHALLAVSLVAVLGLSARPVSAQCDCPYDQQEYGVSGCPTVDDCLTQCGSAVNGCGYVPRSAFLVSLGGSYNSVNFGDQDVIAIGTSDVTNSVGALTATGFAQGPDDASGGTPISMDLEVGFSPTIELGYFAHFAGSQSGLWGAKFSNDYFGVTSNVRLPRFPQVGSFTYTSSPNDPVPFTGNAVALSTQTEIVDQLAFRPFLGHSFNRGFVYFGGGPTLSLMRTEIRDLIGFADINGTRSDISGPAQDFADSDWVWGGSGQVGVTYFFDRNWFLDCSYVLTISSEHTFNFASTFSNTDSDGVTTAGTLVGSSRWQAITQGIGFKIGRAF
jgi:hypothetical protein